MNNMGSCVTASVSYANWPKQAFTTAQYNPTPGAVANALVGEKSINSIQYAITGDQEVDFMSGISALIAQAYMDNEARIRCLTHFIERLGGEVKITPKTLKELRDRLDRLERVTIPTPSYRATATINDGTAVPPLGIGLAPFQMP